VHYRKFWIDNAIGYRILPSFSKTGQLWANPLYRWDILKKEGYDWWLRRIEHNLLLFDLTTWIDHFRGFVAYWEAPKGGKTAVKGTWLMGPSDFSPSYSDTSQAYRL
jgi:4-alpha-glucanotransferase